MHPATSNEMVIDSVEEPVTPAPVAAGPVIQKPPVKPIKRIATVLKENADLVLGTHYLFINFFLSFEGIEFLL